MFSIFVSRVTIPLATQINRWGFKSAVDEAGERVKLRLASSLAVSDSANPVLETSRGCRMFVGEVSGFLKDVVGLQVAALPTGRLEALWK